MTAEMGIAVAASCVFLAFANLDKFTKFKGAGFEAELRGVVTEANATIHELKELAKPLIRTNFEILAQANRMQGSNFDKTHDLFDQLQSLQNKLQLDDDQIEKSKKIVILLYMLGIWFMKLWMTFDELNQTKIMNTCGKALGSLISKLLRILKNFWLMRKTSN